ncbi:unnamed protein product [Tilletia controversa]|uniref:Uncharacterized protein n=3 Tax=Tilletia TaxID=13289 RepID=A0A8X7MKR5_9BASI|nr:hypothetical protein CF336_g8859 [Tilletia laevis]KAE8181951.1 hypothetical protein CF328_g8682 [Tilletia controversa]KAE8238665.1 hypothetical protein A4X03_0g8807 [Tilletia caries]KAE8182688.1 hypothetical protein CF335_g8555 [Tilletia laevis]KAE8239127.1 hypothetical protein A4X06_0g8496 [Tilletia controversa]
MPLNRLIASLALSGALAAAAAVLKSQTSIQHHFRVSIKSKIIVEDIVGQVDKLGPVNGNATLVWNDDSIASAALLQVPGSNRTAYSFSRVDTKGVDVQTDTTTKGGWANTEIQLNEDGHGRVFIFAPHPIECRKGPYENTGLACFF